MIKFDAILNRITTTIDGGWRISFDLDESAGSIMADLADLRGEVLKLEIDGKKEGN